MILSFQQASDFSYHNPNSSGHFLYLLSLYFKISLMIILSRWASKHVRAAQIIIILSCILLGILARYFGEMLFSGPIGVSSPLLWTVVGVGVLAMTLYPRRSSSSPKHLRGRKLMVHFVLYQAFILLMAVSGSHGTLWTYEATPVELSQVQSSEADVIVHLTSQKPKIGKQADAPDHGKKLKQKKRKTKKQKRKKRTMSKGGKFVLLLLGAVASYILAGLSCALTCSGSAFLAALGVVLMIVFFLGAIVLFVLAFVVLFRTGNGSGRPPRPPKKNNKWIPIEENRRKSKG